MNIVDMKNAVDDANDTISNADRCVQTMADLIRGRLKCSGVYTYTLCALKRELRDFNMCTKEWKKEN